MQQQKKNCGTISVMKSLTLRYVQASDWDDAEAIALQEGAAAFPPGAKLELHFHNDLQRCADWTGHDRPFDEDTEKKYFVAEVTVNGTWKEKSEKPGHGKAYRLVLRMVQGDNLQGIRDAALEEGREALPSGKVFAIHIKGNLKRCVDGPDDHDFGSAPKKYYAEDVIVSAWSEPAGK